jgi:hypothetical protein
MELAKVNLKLLKERVNKRLSKNYDEPYLSRARSGKAGSAALQDIVHQEEAKILKEAAEANPA